MIAKFILTIGVLNLTPKQKWFLLSQTPYAIYFYPSLVYPSVKANVDSTTTLPIIASILTIPSWYGISYLVSTSTDSISTSMIIASAVGGWWGMKTGCELFEKPLTALGISVAENLGNYYLFYQNNYSTKRLVRFLTWGYIGHHVAEMTYWYLKGEKFYTVFVLFFPILALPTYAGGKYYALGRLLGSYSSFLVPLDEEKMTHGDLWMEALWSYVPFYFAFIQAKLDTFYSDTTVLKIPAHVYFPSLLLTAGGVYLSNYLAKKRDISLVHAFLIDITQWLYTTYATPLLYGNNPSCFMKVIIATGGLTALTGYFYYKLSVPQNSHRFKEHSFIFELDNILFNPLAFTLKARLSLPLLQIYLKF